jgi:hypothetical protein
VLKRIWLAPPLAFARVGPSRTPCPAFLWSDSDVSPRGTGYTALVPAETLALDPAGHVTSQLPAELVFRDEEGIRPVCPFFELHGEWREAGGTLAQGPITAAMLKTWGVPLSKVKWHVQLGSLKAFHYTYEDSDRIHAQVTVQADQNKRLPLLGASPAGKRALIPPSRPMPMGEVQVARCSERFPEIRLRFYPPKGLVYGPSDLAARLKGVDYDHEVGSEHPNREWRGFTLDAERLIVNPQSHWATYLPAQAKLAPLGAADYRNSPTGLLATTYERIGWLKGKPTLQRSLGLVDDVSDGIVSCALTIKGKTLRADARIVVGPPDFAPANRTPVSLADALADREDRGSIRQRSPAPDELRELAADILERAFETSQLIHKDYQNRRSQRTNDQSFVVDGTQAQYEQEDVRAMLWPVPSADDVKSGRAHPMALVEAGTRAHRRLSAIEFLEDRFRENPRLVDDWLRRPLDAKPFFDKRMPALMRGSDGRPFHLTRRQWEIVRLWVASLKKGTAAPGAPGPGK